MPRKRWSELSVRVRRILILGAAFEGILKILTMIDLKRRPANEVRGSKAKWATAVVVINSVGAVPIAYFVYGGRSDLQTSAPEVETRSQDCRTTAQLVTAAHA